MISQHPWRLPADPNAVGVVRKEPAGVPARPGQSHVKDAAKCEPLPDSVAWQSAAYLDPIVPYDSLIDEYSKVVSDPDENIKLGVRH